MQDEDRAVLRAFPPRTLPDLAAQRDVLRGYARTAPLAVLAGYSGAYVLMQVRAHVRCRLGCLQHWLTNTGRSRHQC